METSPALLRPARHVLDLGLGLGRRAVAWPVSSQQGARRNAMIAASEIRHRRREQLEVEAFLAAHRPPVRRRETSSAAMG